MFEKYMHRCKMSFLTLKLVSDHEEKADFLNFRLLFVEFLVVSADLFTFVRWSRKALALLVVPLCQARLSLYGNCHPVCVSGGTASCLPCSHLVLTVALILVCSSKPYTRNYHFRFSCWTQTEQKVEGNRSARKSCISSSRHFSYSVLGRRRWKYRYGPNAAC